MSNQMQMKYLVDMVFCIDATASMGPVIQTVKQNVLNFYQDVTRKMAEKNKKISQMRIRLIAFRDYIADQKAAMLATDFFSLPEQSREFAQCVKGIREEGGGDDPEDGLEALAYAIKSKWSSDSGAKKRQVIVVWTDAGTHEIGYGKKSYNYPKGMPGAIPRCRPRISPRTRSGWCFSHRMPRTGIPSRTTGTTLSTIRPQPEAD